MIAYEYALLRLSVLGQSVTALVLPPTMFSKGFFKTLLPPLTQLRKQIQLQLGHVTFLGLTEKC